MLFAPEANEFLRCLGLPSGGDDKTSENYGNAHNALHFKS